MYLVVQMKEGDQGVTAVREKEGDLKVVIEKTEAEAIKEVSPQQNSQVFISTQGRNAK
jgi:hypothetical protein